MKYDLLSVMIVPVPSPSDHPPPLHCLERSFLGREHESVLGLIRSGSKSFFVFDAQVRRVYE
jgi:hypothetical protein